MIHDPQTPIADPRLRRLAGRPLGLALATTGLADDIAAAGALVLLDAENLVLSARDLGRSLDFVALREALRADGAPDPICHAFYSSGRHDIPLSGYLAARGWQPHARPPIVRRQGEGRAAHLNADTWFAFGAAYLATTIPCGCIVLGTGDGLLGLDVARCLRSLVPTCRTIATLSVPGSTSRLLDSRTAVEIDLNIELGRDVLRPLH